MKRVLAVVTLVLFALLAACAPSTEAEVEVAQLSEPLSFYPQEAGATWQYLPSGSNANDARVIQVVEGPTVLAGELWTVTHLEGFGLDNRWFRKYESDGVYLLKEERPGQEVSYDPPLQEFPASDSLRVGATWGGDTVATVLYPNARAENRQVEQAIEYRYTVVDRRPVEVGAGNFEVFVIDFEARALDEERNVTETFRQTTWFTPFVGEVKTEDDFYLMATNAQ